MRFDGDGPFAVRDENVGDPRPVCGGELDHCFPADLACGASDSSFCGEMLWRLGTALVGLAVATGRVSEELRA